MPPRLKDVPFEDYSQAQKDVLAKVSAARGRIPVPLKVWLQSPKLAQAIEPLSTMLNTQSSLAKREWEIAVIVMAQHWDSPSVLDAHCKFMRAAGSPEPVIAALQAREEPPFETEREKAVYAIAKACDRREPVSDAVFAHAEKALGPDGLAELIAFLGYYSGIAIAMKLYS
jgi:4-carboxymuconolactone decarboxylase